MGAWLNGSASILNVEKRSGNEESKSMGRGREKKRNSGVGGRKEGRKEGEGGREGKEKGGIKRAKAKYNR